MHFRHDAAFFYHSGHVDSVVKIIWYFGSKAGLVLPAGEADEAAALTKSKQYICIGQAPTMYLASVTSRAGEAFCTLPVP